MGKITIYIENRPYVVDDDLTILEAAKICGYNIPNLCTWKKVDAQSLHVEFV